MGENKEYVTSSEELGSINISEEVLSVIAAAAAMEVEGVGGVTSPGGKDLTERLGRKNVGRGARIQVADDSVQIELGILVKYGSSVQDVARAVQDAVSANVESMSGLTVQAVNVTVSGIAFEH